MSTPLARKVFELFGKPQLAEQTRSAAPSLVTGPEAARSQTEETRPYLTTQGELILPCDCAPRYRYWAAGQSVAATLWELNGPPEVWRRYTDVPYGPVQ